MPAPSGSTMPPRTWIVAPGQSAESGRFFAVGKTDALNPSVSRQYELVLKIR